MSNRNLRWELAIVSDIANMCRDAGGTESVSKTIHTSLARARTIAKMCSGFAEIDTQCRAISVVLDGDRGQEVSDWKLLIKPLKID